MITTERERKRISRMKWKIKITLRKGVLRNNFIRKIRLGRDTIKDLFTHTLIHTMRV